MAKKTEYIIAYLDKFYERKEDVIWLVLGKKDIDERLGYETSDEQWDSIFELLDTKLAEEIDLIVDTTLNEITGV